LSPNVRRVILAGAAADGLLKIAALIDLCMRPADQVRGSKKRWAAGIVFVNSAGVIPISYFIRGKRR
jgi:hypothetical protein